jgi:hypothetical protein
MALWPNDDSVDIKRRYAQLREKPAAGQDTADIVLKVGNDSDDEAGFIQAK